MLAQEEQARERARQERDASEKLETRRLLDEAVAARQKVMMIEQLTPCRLMCVCVFCTDHSCIETQADGEAQRAGKEADETRAMLGKERERATRDLAALREQFRSVEAEKTEGKPRRAPKRACNDVEEAQPRPPLTVSVCAVVRLNLSVDCAGCGQCVLSRSLL